MRLSPRPAALAALLALAQPLAAQAPAGGAGDIVVNMRGVEIADVAEQISRLTGRTLILDPGVKGVVNVTSAEPLTPAGVWELFQSVLRVHGFAAVRSGRAWRIIPQASAVRDSGATTGRISGQEMTTRVIRLSNVPPDAAARIFRPLVAQFGSVEPLTSPNAIVITDFADNVRRIERLARALDGGGGGGFETIQLRSASAKDVAAAIQGVMGEAGGTGGPRVVADERSNLVLVRGDARLIAEARRIARTLEATGGASAITRVFRLRNADAEAMTRVLQGLLGQQDAATNPVARSLAGGRAALTGTARSGNLGLSSGLSAVGATPNAAAVTDLTAAAQQQPGQSTAQGFATPDLVVQPAPELNAIVVRGTPTAIKSIEPLIADLDVRRPQVLIEAAIVEITGDDAEALGIQLGLGAGALRVADGAATSFTTLGLPLQTILAAIGAPASVGVLPSGVSGNVRVTDNFSILVQALSQSTKANLLSTPSLTTLDNAPAEIVVGQNVPFRTGSFTTAGNTINPFTTIERQDVGITLRVVPRVHEGDVVRLEVGQEVSSLIPATVAGAADLITNRRSIETTVLADNGETIVLGGLISDDRQQIRSQVPVLGDIPVVGELFKSRRESKLKRTLFVFLKPTILRDRATAAAVTQEKYGKLRGSEYELKQRSSLILYPPRPRLPLEIKGLY